MDKVEKLESVLNHNFFQNFTEQYTYRGMDKKINTLEKFVV